MLPAAEAYVRGLRGQAGWLAPWFAAAIGFALPLSVAGDGILLGAAVALLLASGGYRDKLSQIAATPVALAALALFAWLALGLLHGERDPGDGLDSLGKYLDLAALALLLPLFREAPARRRALLALAAAILLTLAVSYGIAAGIIPKGWLRPADPTSAIAFKLRVTHGYLVAFGAFLFALLAREAAGGTRLGWAAASALAALNVLFLVQGQTGWVVFAALALYLAFVLFGGRGLAAALALGAALAAAGYLVSDGLRVRLQDTAAQVAAFRSGQQPTTADSAGMRLEFYRHSAAIVAEHPLLGVGTGGFPKAYAERAAAGRVVTDNPHNEYLLIAAQTGLPGLALLLALFAIAWHGARRLAPLERDLARGIVLATAVGCLFNSLLADHTEGLLFAWLSAVAFGGLKSRRP
jgi:O-antigen ligase